jgi:hypothetical protein
MRGFFACAQNDKPYNLAAGEDEVDGDVGEGEESAKGRGDSFEALHGLLVIVDAGFEVGEAAGLAVAEDFLHLRFEDAEVGEDLGFKVGHV